MITEILMIMALYGLGFNGTHNVTVSDCPTGPAYDLVYRSWCNDIIQLVEPEPEPELEPERNHTDDDWSEFQSNNYYCENHYGGPRTNTYDLLSRDCYD